MTTDSLFGIIDNSGECVVKPEYISLNDHGDGKFIGVNKRYKDNLKKGNKDKVKISVVDTSGKVLLDISGDKYENMHNAFVDGLLPVSVKKEGKESWGIINDKGETVVKPATKIKNIGEINGDKFTYNNGDGWGLMNIKGETLIRAKYESLYYDSDDRLIALVKNGDTVEYKYIDTKDNQIETETYVVATFFSMFDGQHALVKPNDKIFSIIDKKGNQIDGLPDIVDVGIFEGELYIESDYVDIAKFVSELKITEEGVFGLTYTSSAQDGVAIQVKQGNARSTNEHKAGTPYWYDYSDEISFDANANTRIFIGYTGKLSKQDFRNERVIDYTIGDWYYYHDEKIPTGYSWNNVTPTMFLVRVTNDGRMHGKLRDIFKALSEKFKKYRTVAKQNNGAIVVEMKNGTRAEIIMEKDCVLAFWGKLLQDAEDIDIDEYKDASEEDDGENISYGYLSQLFPGKKNIYIEDVDSVAVDTVVAD